MSADVPPAPWPTLWPARCGGTLVVAVERAGVLHLFGELCLASAADTERQLLQWERRGGPALVLDLRGLTFINLSGLDVLLAAASRARAAGRELTILLGPPTARLLEVLGIEHERLPGRRPPVWRPTAAQESDRPRRAEWATPAPA